MIHTLSMFNTGQITLPKKWRDKQGTNKFIAEETDEGLLIKPIKKDEIVYYEDDERFGIYCEKGLDIKKMLKVIKKLNGQDN
jgi:bifunctional DNA-binding transcriptional regulator/antitoxin component of YhaV-PrlF toxin-antitoxin module